MRAIKKYKLIVRLKGGLGNQMFQYATARALSIRNNMDLVLDTRSGFVRDKVYQRSFSLGELPIEFKEAHLFQEIPFWLERTRQKILNEHEEPIRKRSWGDFVYEADQRFLEIVAAHIPSGNIWMEGYWQCERYFTDYRDTIFREFSLPEPFETSFIKMAQTMESCESVAIGVRLFEEVPGDCKSVVGGVVPISFYERAAEQLASNIKNPIFFVFCTVENAVRDKLKLPGSIHYITHDNGFPGDLEGLWLFSKCRHHILSNSSFYWWGTWLSERHISEKITIACDKFPNPDTIPSRWATMATD